MNSVAFVSALPLRTRSSISSASLRKANLRPCLRSWHQNNLPSACVSSSSTSASASASPSASVPATETSITPLSSTTSENAPLQARWHRAVPVSFSVSRAARSRFGSDANVLAEAVYIAECTSPLSSNECGILEWLLSDTFGQGSILTSDPAPSFASVPLIGPRLNFATAWGSNAASICRACGAGSVLRIERFFRYVIEGANVKSDEYRSFLDDIHDAMTECVYDDTQILSLESGREPEATREIDVLGGGDSVLREMSDYLGLGFDDDDIQYYTWLFREDMKRNPTDVELFDLAQSNSEHSRHWFFKGKIVIDGVPIPKDLFSLVKEPLLNAPGNSVIAFADNSSTIRGSSVPVLEPSTPGESSRFEKKERDLDVLYTAETHNFPSGVAPFPGAETGSGGRIRDTAATGTGSLVVAGTAGYAVGNLQLEEAPAEWEDKTFGYPGNLARPKSILVQASNGASDYGNKFGEPVICGFARSYGIRNEQGERREYVKPIMFSGGIGQMHHSHIEKGKPKMGMCIVKIGGPAYRIGLGGGAASSMTQGDNRFERDFNAVQRGDAEMEQKAYRVIRACVELGDKNPIVSLHDQGAGGNCNVVKELIYPAGAKIDLRSIWLGDSTLSALEIWGAEYQEQFGLLIRPENLPVFQKICDRENVVACVLGSIDNSGRIVLWDSAQNRTVVDMDLERVLGSLPQKTFVDQRVNLATRKLELPEKISVAQALDRVLSLMTVGSKRFLTTKVDRSVTGLVAQQQTVGPLQLPLADAAVIAQSHFSLRGAATAIGERPALTALSPQAMARMSVGEMLTNMGCVKITAREDIKCEANWMWAAKLAGDAASICDAADAMSTFLIELGIAVDGGKDSLSMAAKCPMKNEIEETVRAPGTLVISGYATVENVEWKVTPDVKRPGESVIVHVDIANGKRRLGGSALAQVFGQIGDIPPDVESSARLAGAFDVVQKLIAESSRANSLEKKKVLSYHDVGDGGLLVAVLEMGFAGNCGLDVSVNCAQLQVDEMAGLFAEELGMLLEVPVEYAEHVQNAVRSVGVNCSQIAMTRADKTVTVRNGDTMVLESDIRKLRDTWERTSFALERLQAKESCVDAEQAGLCQRVGPKYVIPYVPEVTDESILKATHKPKVAIVREEGSNGDREMTAAFDMAGFETWDVSMRDLGCGRVSLGDFQGIAFVGGFSYADVLDSAKGWAGVIRFRESVQKEFDEFYRRKDTFSLGICNGCQLMSLLGIVPFGKDGLKQEWQPRFVHNESERYESRFATVCIAEDTKAVMLRGMQGARLGVWVAHGEGRAHFPDKNVLNRVVELGLVPIYYVDDDGKRSTEYPHNPNGSALGIAGLCSADGRHLAMMPHPERTFLKWQWPYLCERDAIALNASPWLRMFQNARAWCDANGSEQVR